MIPKQLQQKDFRFCKIRRQSKAPFEFNWQKNGYDYNQIKDWIDKGNNYGVIGGYGNLRILDSDSSSFAEEMKKKLPKTFTVKTGGGGYHFYFLSDYNENHVFKDNNGELRSLNYQVVGPNSIHPNGNKYSIEVDAPLASISKEELSKIIKDYIKVYDLSTPNFDTRRDSTRSGREFGEVIRLIKKGFSKEEIFKEMMYFSKWSNSHPKYRELTYEKAKRLVEGNISEKELVEILNEAYLLITKILKNYCDLREEYYNIIALWIIGTYLHKNFNTYPYLFFNAMRSSGKSRLLNLISHLSYNGKHLINMSEPVLFRTAGNTTFCIDEFERIASKDKTALRELLNAAYKKGMSVERLKKVINKQGEKYEIERFNVFSPICMANIWGMEDVLSDRCIPLILEKSNNPAITKKVEIFENDNDINYTNYMIYVVSVMKLREITYIYSFWNDFQNYTNYNNYTNYINNKTITTYIHTHTNYTNYINNYISLFDKIQQTNLDGRHLELFFPLIIIANYCGEEILNETLETAKKIVAEKKETDILENKDVSLIDFVAQQQECSEFISIKEILKNFKEFLKEDDEENKWVNSKWIGRALTRLNLIVEKRRKTNGIEVTLNYEKARQKIKIFKEPKVPQEIEE